MFIKWALIRPHWTSLTDKQTPIMRVEGASATVHNSFKWKVHGATWRCIVDSPTRPFDKKQEKTAPVCFIHKMCTRQYTSRQQWKNWIKKVSHVIWIRNFFLCAPAEDDEGRRWKSTEREEKCVRHLSCLQSKLYYGLRRWSSGLTLALRTRVLSIPPPKVVREVKYAFS